MAGCEYFTFINNTIKGVGQVGNLFYITTYNTDTTNNGHATIINNTITGPEKPLSICIAAVISGHDILFHGNKINYTGEGVGIQWNADSTEDNNYNITVTNNTLTGCILSTSHAIVNYNKGQYIHVGDPIEVIGNEVDTLGIDSNEGSPHIANNTIKTTATLKTNNTIFENNTITKGTLNITGNNNTITNNNIYSEDMYTITIDKNSVNNTIIYNKLTTPKTGYNDSGIYYYNITGDNTVNSPENNTIILNGPGYYYFNVTSYNQLIETINYIKTNCNTSNAIDGYIINLLDGDYNVTSAITWGDATTDIRNITIIGNNQTINGLGNSFLTINNGYTIQLYNLTLNNSTNGITNNGNLIISNCTFSNTTGTNKYIIKTNINGITNITNSTFTNNHLTTAGINLIHNNMGTLYFTNNTIKNNTNAKIWLQAIGQNSLTSTIENNIFENNTNNKTVLIQLASTSTKSNNKIQFNLFKNNNATSELIGGINRGTLTLTYNTYINSTLGVTMTTPSSTTLTNENYNTTIQVTIKNNNYYKTTVNNGKITVYINGNEYKTFNLTNQESNIQIENNALNKETNTILLAYNSDDTSYKPTNTTFTISIDPTANNITTKLTTNPLITTKVQQPTNITATLTKDDNTPINGQNITITINEQEYTTTTDNNGQATITYTPTTSTTQTITIKYNGEERYQPTETTTTLNVNKIETTTTLTTPTTRPQINTNYQITININDEYNNPITAGSLEIYINNILNTTQTFNNGQLTTTITMDKAEHNITVKFVSDNVYETSNTTGIIQAEIFNTTTNTPTITTQTGKEFTITTQVYTDNEYIVNDGIVEYYINNQYFNQAEVTNGVAQLTTTINTKGNYILTTKYVGTFVFNPSETYSIISVEKTREKVVLNITTTDVHNINEETTITTKVTTTNGTLVNEGIIETYLNGILISINNVENGIATTTTPITKLGTNSIITKYTPIENYYTQANNTTITLSNIQTTMTVNNITTQLAKTITLQATITDTQQNNINEGKVVFKLNGITLKDKNGNPLYAQVQNGKATLTYTLPNTWTNLQTKTITAVYSGTNIYQSTRNSQAKLHLTKDSTTPTTLTINNTITNEKTVTTTITINTNETLNTGTITLKINNKTIRDKNGKPLTAQVQNNKATLTYTLPTLKTQNYTLTATYNNPQNNKITNTTTLTIQKTNTNIQINPITTNKNENTQITAKLTDDQGNTINRNTKIAIKINGKTIKYTTAQNGIINTTINTTTLKQKNYTLTLTAGENNQYTKTTKNTTLTITQ